jgi:hypothetical protein
MILKSLMLDVLESLKPLLIAFRVISSLGAQASYHLASQKWVVLASCEQKTRRKFFGIFSQQLGSK